MLTLYNVLQARPKLFDAIELPEGLPRDDVVNAILIEGITLPPLYYDPALFEHMVNHYFHTRLRIHEQLVTLATLDYNPIQNYDRTETSSENTSGERSGTSSSESESAGTGEREVSAFNVSDYSPNDRSASAGSASMTGTQEETHRETRTLSSRVSGNIGVTTSQQMIESSIELMGVLDICRYIARDFVHELLVCVY